MSMMAECSCEDAIAAAQRAECELRDIVQISRAAIVKALNIKATATVTAENISDYVRKSFVDVNETYRIQRRTIIRREAGFFRRRNNESVEELVTRAFTLCDRVDKDFSQLHALYACFPHILASPQREHTERCLAEFNKSQHSFRAFQQSVRNFAEAYRDALRIIDLPRPDMRAATSTLSRSPTRALRSIINSAQPQVDTLAQALTNYSVELRLASAATATAVEMFTGHEEQKTQVTACLYAIAMTDLSHIKSRLQVSSAQVDSALQGINALHAKAHIPTALPSARPFLQGREVSIDKLARARTEFDGIRNAIKLRVHEACLLTINISTVKQGLLRAIMDTSRNDSSHPIVDGPSE
ncbi:hypothetical protein C8Q76DRAFT_798060 [Earliella scabrosa]|nr:hypothetical protein C8Q76DRAFT_798060 [Earliella scabrosa]